VTQIEMVWTCNDLMAWPNLYSEREKNEAYQKAGKTTSKGS